MPEHKVCPWWMGYVLACPILRPGQNPGKILSPYVREGMTTLEPGPGMGFFTLELARRVGGSGRVIAVDIQPRMLERLKRRAAKQGLLERVETRLAHPDSLGIEDLSGKVDFVLAFAMVHEMPSAEGFFRQASAAMKAGAILLFSEPKGHVKPPAFEANIETARRFGLCVVEKPQVSMSHAALLQK